MLAGLSVYGCSVPLRCRGGVIGVTLGAISVVGTDDNGEESRLDSSITLRERSRVLRALDYTL